MKTRRRPPRREKGPHAIDIAVGARVRLRRNMLGLSQDQLGKHLGLAFQQVQKYERGANRIGASRLYEIALFFDVPVSFFFDKTDPVHAPALEPVPRDDPFTAPDVLELVGVYWRLEPEVRAPLLDLVRVLGPTTRRCRRRRAA
jgi:transcriptional regulator with XRE-family HTH domain